MALIRFLKSGELETPTAITKPPTKDVAEHGIVEPNFEEGSIFLRDSDDRIFRLSWENYYGRSIDGSKWPHDWHRY